MYTDLATLLERAGIFEGRPGSVTQIPILTMPDDDITHPIPDLTGYITEGQLVLSRELHQRGVMPPVDVLPSLSRLMSAGIGAGRTVPEHREWANQLYASYSQGREARLMAAVVGEAGLSEADRRSLAFAERFEREFVGQERRRSLAETIATGWRLLETLPRDDLLRLSDATWSARLMSSRCARAAPTRQNLLALQRRLERIAKGTGLLRRKREALVAELFRLARPAASARASIADRAATAYPALLSALARRGSRRTPGTGLARTRSQGGDPRRPGLGNRGRRNPAPAADSPYSARTRSCRREPLPARRRRRRPRSRSSTELLLDAANREALLRRLGDALARTSRQVNTLERRLEPALRVQPGHDPAHPGRARARGAPPGGAAPARPPAHLLGPKKTTRV